MSTAPVQPDQDQLLRNLAITLGTQPRQIPAVGPQMAAPGPIQMPSGPAPDLSIGGQPAVKAPRGTIQGDQAERTRLLSTGAGEDQIYGRVTGSKLGQAHPMLGKILGGLGEGVAKLGDIGLSAVAPALAINLPGTEYHHQMELNRANRQIGEESKEGQEAATTQAEQGRTGLEAEETKELPGKTQSEENLQGAEADKDRAPLAQGPDLAQAYAHRVNEVIASGGDPSTDPVVQHLSDAITSIQKQPVAKGTEHVDVVGTDGKPMMANYNPATGETTDAQGKVIPNPRPYEKPNQAGMVTMIVPDPNTPGGGVVERLGAGSKVAPGAQTTAGFNAVNTPTTQQRTAAGRAQTVVAMAPEVLSRIDALAPKMGPIEGRWNEYMQGKVGMDDPDFAALRSDLLMMSSAVALAHAQGRLPENLREEFDGAINAPHQTPANLKATIQAMLPWLQQMQSQGRPGSQGQSAGPPAGTVEGGYRFKGGDPGNQENWEKVK